MGIEPGPSGSKTDALSIGPRVMCDDVCVMCHVSCVTRRESFVMCHVSCAMCHAGGVRCDVVML